MSQELPQSQVWALIRFRGDDLLGPIKATAAIHTYHCGEQIYGTDDIRNDWYRVVIGAARNCLLLPDGRRRIVDFFLAGDFFGLGAENGLHLTVEAASDGAVVVRYPRRQVEALADSNPLIGRGVREVALQAVSRSHSRMLILGRVTAIEKVMSFLAEMAQRSSGPDAMIDLQVSRYDIADYLALSVETVCRALTQLQYRHRIAMHGKRRIKIIRNLQLR